MIDLQNAHINTAGAYVCVNGYYVFAIGIRPHNGHLPIVRLGGHREGDESGWQCAVREVYEEAGLRINPLPPRITYLSDGDHIETELQEIQWIPEIEHELHPNLIVAYNRQGKLLLSMMYLARAEGLPMPSAEVRGLLLLTTEEIHRLCHIPLTLEQYLDEGGMAILNADFDKRLLLEPFVQLRLLSKILSLQPEQ